MDAAEEEAFAAALAEERKQLDHVRVHVKAGFAVLPIFLFFVFSVILVLEFGGTAGGFLLAGVPGFFLFGALVYAMVVSRAQYERVEAAKRAAEKQDGENSREKDGEKDGESGGEESDRPA